MNKKGFAISIILYSVILLIIAILYLLLGIEKNRTNTSEELRDNILSNYNSESDCWSDSWTSMKDFVSLQIIKQENVK